MHPFCQIKGNSWPLSLSVCKHPVCFFCLCQVRKGFWKPPPQIWLGDASKVRVLDPHFLHQTAVKLLKINFHPKSKQVSDHFHLSVFCLVFCSRDYAWSQFVVVEVSVQIETKLSLFLIQITPISYLIISFCSVIVVGMLQYQEFLASSAADFSSSSVLFFLCFCSSFLAFHCFPHEC